MDSLTILDPEQLLDLFKSIQTKRDINLKLINVNLDGIQKDNVPINVEFNGYQYKTWLYIHLPEVIGAYYYMADTQKAYNIAAESVVESLQGWYENIYEDYVYADTGYYISASFSQEVIDEINRINNLFE